MSVLRRAVDFREILNSGVGKPQPLRENLSGFWSRRIDEQNRLLAVVRDQR
jgi:Txe/YoeB family toxin of Txe-Axe toxin-antitoxin module